MSAAQTYPASGEVAGFLPGGGGRPGLTEFVTAGGVRVSRAAAAFDPARLAEITRQVDERRGGVLSSGMEYPGRYSRWHVAYVDPCVEIVARGRRIGARALNQRGQVLLPVIAAGLRRAAAGAAAKAGTESGAAAETGTESGAAGSAKGNQAAAGVEVLIPDVGGTFAEEERSRRPTVFSALREVVAAFAGPDPHLGLYGAFGYDLAFQFEPVKLRHPRDDGQRDLVLHLPDRLYVIDRKRETAICYSYEFTTGGSPDGAPPHGSLPDGSLADGSLPDGSLPDGSHGASRTAGMPRLTAPSGRAGSRGHEPVSKAGLIADPQPGSYARVVQQARERFARGDLFEVVPSQAFRAPCGSPAAFYERLRQRNPAPYEFFLNLGEGEYLVGASPEMYVRVTGDRVETCPIAGTIARGAGPLEDAENIRTLLDSAKEESELTMCTDVDRNDKSRICEPGSIAVIGRRQIEMYSRVIHTVDHVEGRLRPGFDALDAFLTHMWAVTVTGAPKTWAMQFIEDHEDGRRRWYGGAVGMIGFDGGMSTGLTLRTAHIRDDVATVRAGATLLFDSDPAAEERETQLKALALLETLAEPEAKPEAKPDATGTGSAGSTAAKRGHLPGLAALPDSLPGTGMRVLLVDHQDSFVHTLAGYFREQGAAVTTLRAGFDAALLDASAPDLVVLSPGPGRPSDFGCAGLLKELDARGLSVFGVCLGLQAMVEHAGGRLSVLAVPVHGKPSAVRVLGGSLLAGLPAEFSAGRYHSLHATAAEVGCRYSVTAVTSDGVVMAIEDEAAGRWGVQFHPESILTASGGAGHQVIAKVLRLSRVRARC
jgi:anthranilate synthase